MKTRSRITAIAALGGALLLTAPGVASASPVKWSKCWITTTVPEMVTDVQVKGTATFTCLNGQFAPGVPNLNERIVSMDMDVQLQSYDVANGWTIRDEASSHRDGADRMPVTVRASCDDAETTRWRVHIDHAWAEEHAPDPDEWFGDKEEEHEFWNESGPEATLNCG